MDLLSSIRKQGSRGGVDFKWDDVQTSAHRENYLGHSLMAPVGRWQKGRDLSWYARADDAAAGSNETAEERRVRERKEEIRKIKEAEEDALARALGLPVTSRNGGEGTGANDIDIGEMRRVIKDTEDGDDEIDEVGRNAGFGNFVGRSDDGVERHNGDEDTQHGGLLGKLGKKGRQDRSRRKEKGERRSRSRSRERRHRRHRQRSRSPEPNRLRDAEDSRRSKRHRSRSAERGHRHRSQSAEPHRSRRDERERRRSRSPNPRGRPRRWEKDEERERRR